MRCPLLCPPARSVHSCCEPGAHCIDRTAPNAGGEKAPRPPRQSSVPRFIFFSSITREGATPAPAHTLAASTSMHSPTAAEFRTCSCSVVNAAAGIAKRDRQSMPNRLFLRRLVSLHRMARRHETMLRTRAVMHEGNRGRRSAEPVAVVQNRARYLSSFATSETRVRSTVTSNTGFGNARRMPLESTGPAGVVQW